MASAHVLNKELEGLQRKLQVLVTAHRQLKGEIESLREENQGLKQKLEKQDEKLSDFQNQVKFIKIADVSTAEKTEVEEVKQQLTEYIKQIDRAIALLSD